jgi:hypothetical protein
MPGILLLAGGAMFAGGLWLTKRYSAVANDRGIGGFRLTREGLAHYLGSLLIVAGLVFVGAAILLVY